MKKTLSVIIPNYNGETTLPQCLDAVFSSRHDSFEVIVVDDCSDDHSIEIIKQYPCSLIELSSHRGAAAARNAGAVCAQGEVLFFTDADCVIWADTLAKVERNFRKQDKQSVVGGTYTCRPFDHNFFSLFQSVFVHYSEVKNKEKPDYIATHAMAISRSAFMRSGGFCEDFPLPIIEDVEYSHHLLENGFKLVIDPEIQVRHIFNFSFVKSIKNAFRKSKYWTIYSLGNQDLLKDSGCASFELKANFCTLLTTLLLFVFQGLYPAVVSPFLVLLPVAVNLFISRHLVKLYYQTGGLKIASMAAVYYMLIYAAVVGSGGIAGVYGWFAQPQKPFADPKMLVGECEE